MSFKTELQINPLFDPQAARDLFQDLYNLWLYHALPFIREHIQWTIQNVVEIPPDFRLLASGTLLFALVLILSFPYIVKANLTHIPTLRQPTFQALSNFIIPTTARWPTSFTLPSAHIKDGIEIPLSSFIQDICDGQIELRQPGNLHSMFPPHSGPLLLRTGYSWQTRVLRWIISTSLKGPMATPEIHSRKPLPDHHSSILIPPLLPGDLHTTLCLDFVPYTQVDVCVRKFIKSLPSGKPATIEFTAINPHTHFLSNSFVLCALPFMPYQHLKIPADTRCIEHTYTPLLISLARIVELLGSISPRLQIKSIEQLSGECSRSLLTRERMLLEDKMIRDDFIQQWTLSGWREYRFMLAWEAGLFYSGLLARWKVVVQK